MPNPFQTSLHNYQTNIVEPTPQLTCFPSYTAHNILHSPFSIDPENKLIHYLHYLFYVCVKSMRVECYRDFFFKEKKIFTHKPNKSTFNMKMEEKYHLDGIKQQQNMREGGMVTQARPLVRTRHTFSLLRMN